MSRGADKRTDPRRRDPRDVRDDLDRRTDPRPLMGDSAYDELARAMLAGFAYMEAARGGGTPPTADTLNGAIAVMEEAIQKPSSKSLKELRKRINRKFRRLERMNEAELAELRGKVAPGDTTTPLEYDEVAILVGPFVKNATEQQLKEVNAVLNKAAGRISLDEEED